MVAAWRAAHPSQDADMKMNAASLDEQLQSQTRAIHLLEEKVDRQERDILALEGEIGSLHEAIAVRNGGVWSQLHN
jgi:peptidoglycan hydrolase CwlO-like protein